jgi:hypothetical protein
MRTIITITELARAPGSFEMRSSRIRGNVSAGRGPEAAAASAMSEAIAGGGGYVIFAPKEVLACIPADMRSRD